MIPYRKAVTSLLPALCFANLLLFVFLLTKTAITNWSLTPKRDQQKQNPRHDSIVSTRFSSHDPRTNMTSQGEIILTNTHILPYKWRSIDELKDRVVPVRVFYVWCGNRTFEYKHYLAVLSVWYTLEPDVIDMKYEFVPREDFYNTWFTLLKTNIPVFNAQPLPHFIKGDKCTSEGLEIVRDRGGIFLHENTLLWGQNVNKLFKNKFSAGFFENSIVAFVASTERNPSIRRFQSYLREIKGDPQMVSSLGSFKCSKFQNGVKSPGLKGSGCHELQGELYPRDILHDKINMLSLSIKQHILLHDPDILKTRPRGNLTSNTMSEIPRIVHYIWFRRGELTFSMYLSFLSTVYIAKPTAIFIHTDYGLTGKYWNIVKEHHLVSIVPREAPRYIFHHRLRFRQHLSDIVRADILDKYGGIYLDWDVYWLKPPDDLLTSGHSTILSRDHMPRKHFPDTINMGIVMATPRSEFIRRWRASLVNYKSDNFFYNAIELPYKIYEMYPQSVHIVDHMQVMCYYLMCHPTWDPNFRNWNHAQPFDWKKDAYAIHFTYPDPPAFESEFALTTLDDTFAQIGRHIWRMQEEPVPMFD